MQMKIVKGFRLLLEVYGALFWLVILFGAVVQGLLPYQTFIELGALGFYLIFGGALVLPRAASCLSGVGACLYSLGEFEARRSRRPG
jgi:hypothetical protein